MNLLRGFGIVLVAVAVAIGALLLVRRRAPDGGYFNDGDRAAGVFGVLATGFSVLLGFIVFLGFESYDQSRTGAEDEALVVAQQVETAQLFPEASRTELTGGLVCYARSVAGPGWELMREGKIHDDLNPWGVELFKTLERADPQTATEEAAYGKWLDQTSDREQARVARIHAADGVIPAPLWVVLIALAMIIFGFMLFFADSGERAVVQGVLMGSVVTVMAAMLLLIQFLDDPYGRGVGGLEPVAMERTLSFMDQALELVGHDAPLPCDAQGLPPAGR